MNFGMTCPKCGGDMEMIGVGEQGCQCDICGFKYDALGNHDTSEMEECEDENE